MNATATLPPPEAVEKPPPPPATETETETARTEVNANILINLLLVDDETRNLDVLESILEAPDRRLVRAQSAEAALLALIQNDFAVIVLDIQMPGTSGFELAKIVKLRKRNQHIPIIFLTAYYQEDKDVLSGYDIGAVDYLTKPVAPQILKSKVNVFVDLFRTTHALAAMNLSLENEIAERKRLEAEILQVSEREQRRIAEDLHDGVSQQLGGISCLSEALKANLSERGSPEAATAAKISQLLNVTMAQTRALARGLYPVETEANGLMSALEDLAASVADLFKASCHFECRQPVLVKDNTVATHLYRIAQEAVTNSVKHGQAQQITIGLSASPERIILAVSDNGIGFKRSAPPSKGLGLRIMNHRASMIGGTFVVQKKSGGGTVAICTVPRDPGPTSEN